MTARAAQLDDVPPISEPQQRALAAAEQAAKRFAFAPKLAYFNGVSLLLAAALSLVFALSEPAALASVAVLAACGFIELAYGKKLRAYDPSAPVYLALNQLGLFAAIAAYAGLKLRAALTGQLSLARELEAHPELMKALEQLDDPAIHDALLAMTGMFRTGLLVGYSALIAISALVQGGAAYYYLSRRKYLREFLERTPGWVVEMLRRSS